MATFDNFSFHSNKVKCIPSVFATILYGFILFPRISSALPLGKLIIKEPRVRVQFDKKLKNVDKTRLEERCFDKITESK